MQVFSRKDTLHAPNFKNVGEHLIHSVDKQDEGAASPTPMSPSPDEGLSHKHPSNKFAYLPEWSVIFGDCVEKVSSLAKVQNLIFQPLLLHNF